MGSVGTENVHFLKLPNHGGTVVGNGCTNPGQHRVIMAERLLPIIQVWNALLQVDRELECVENLYRVASLKRSFFKASCAVGINSPR